MRHKSRPRSLQPPRSPNRSALVLQVRSPPQVRSISRDLPIVSQLSRGAAGLPRGRQARGVNRTSRTRTPMVTAMGISRLRSALRISFSRPSRASSASRASSNGPIRSSTISATAFARLSLATSCFSQMTWVLARPSRQSRRFGSSSGFDGSSQPFSSSLQPSCSSRAARFASGHLTFERARSEAPRPNALCSGRRRSRLSHELRDSPVRLHRKRQLATAKTCMGRRSSRRGATDQEP